MEAGDPGVEAAGRAVRPEGASEPPAPRRAMFGFIALALTALAFLAMVLRGPVVEELHADDAPVGTLDESAGWLSKAVTVAREVKRIKEGSKIRSARERTSRRIGLGAAIAGSLGILLAALAWVRREDHRLCAAAAGLGVFALAFEFLFAAIVVGVALALLSRLV